MKQSPYLVDEGGIELMEGSTEAVSVRIPTKTGSSPTLSTPLMYVYKNGSDVTSTYTTGSMSVSGDIIVTKEFTSLVGGDLLNVTIFAIVDGSSSKCVAEFPLSVLKKSGRS